MSRIGLTIKSTELRPGEVMRTGERFVWSPSAGNGLYVNGDAMTCEIVLLSCEPWALHVALSPGGTIIAVDVPADAEALARVCRGEAPTPALSIDTSGPTTMTAPAEGLPLVVTISGRVVLAPGQSLTYESGAAVAVEHPDATLIAALRAHPDPLGLLARAKIAGPWQEHEERNYWMRVSVADERVAAGASAQRPGADCAAEDARLLADGWRLL